MSRTFSKLDNGMTSLPSQWQLKICKLSCHLWLVIAPHQDLWNSFTAYTAPEIPGEKETPVANKHENQRLPPGTPDARVQFSLRVFCCCFVGWNFIFSGFGCFWQCLSIWSGCAEWAPAGSDRLTCQNVSVFGIKSLSFPSCGVFAQGLLTGIYKTEFVISEFQKLWRSIPVDSMDEEKIEEYLKRQGISSMQETGPKKIVRDTNYRSS